MNLEQIEALARELPRYYPDSHVEPEISLSLSKIIALIALVRELEAERDELREATRWRDVREELPPPSDVVLARSKNGGSVSAMYAPGMGWDSPLSSIVAHWQPLSQPPKEQL